MLRKQYLQTRKPAYLQVLRLACLLGEADKSRSGLSRNSSSTLLESGNARKRKSDEPLVCKEAWEVLGILK